MDDDTVDKDWKLKLRYGQLPTPFKHYTAIAEDIVGDLAEGFSCRSGNAFMAMKTWASSADESAEMVQVIGEKVGFQVTGNIQVYDTEPAQPPQSKPFGSDISFTPLDF